MNQIKVYLFVLLLLIFTLIIKADEAIDENKLFADTTTSVDSSHVIDKSMSSTRPDSTKVSFSGDINSVVDAGFQRDFFLNQISRKEITPSAYIIGNLMLDVRLPMDIKAFSNVETHFRSDSSKVSFYLQELFIDANIKRKLYIRTGKQVLQWGRCYTWNPTDLVNVEQKTIAPKLGYREGAYGIKMHVPFGTRFNMYGFIDMRHFSSVDSIAGAFKSEVLLGTTEIAAEVWGKREKQPVFGLDFSTSLLKFDISGEMSVESGKNYTIVNGLLKNESLNDYLLRTANDKSSSIESTIGNKPVTKICLGITRSFDLLEIKDRVMVITEFYFNQAGISGDFFNEHKVRESLSMMTSDSQSDTSTSFNRLKSKFYNPNNFSRFYLSLCTNINKFIISDMTFQLRGIYNIEQKGAYIVGSLQYTTIHNLSIGLVLTGALGSNENEYNVFPQLPAFSTRLNVGISF